MSIFEKSRIWEFLPGFSADLFELAESLGLTANLGSTVATSGVVVSTGDWEDPEGLNHDAHAHTNGIVDRKMKNNEFFPFCIALRTTTKMG